MSQAVQDTLELQESDEWPQPTRLLIPARDLKPHAFRPNEALGGIYCHCNLPRGNRIHC